MNSNFIVSVILTLAIMVLAAIAGDYYFDLNDDVLMKDILAGVYTGTPAGHNIQMLYPISLLISLFYRVSAKLDWYGIFLCVCQYSCLYIVLNRGMELLSDTRLQSGRRPDFQMSVIKKAAFALVFLAVTWDSRAK